MTQPPMAVTLWLSVYEQYCPSGQSELWVRRMPTHFAPREHDHVHLSVDEDGDSDGVDWTVRHVYWQQDGSYHAELTHMVVDPGDGQPFGDGYASSWWTTTEGGRPEPMLRRGGWVTYQEWRTAEREKEPTP